MGLLNQGNRRLLPPATRPGSKNREQGVRGSLMKDGQRLALLGLAALAL